MDLSTTYLGFELPHPLMPGASPLVDDLDTVRRLEDSGAAAIVMHSLFEEQLEAEAMGAVRHRDSWQDSFGEALSFHPHSIDYGLGPEEYLEQVRLIREAVGCPVIASLNGTSPGGWIDHARLIEEAGASALELNLYHVPTEPLASGAEIEERLLEVLRSVREATKLPLAVKLSPFFSSPPHFACSVDEIGVEGLVLFNRFYQPDLDVDNLAVSRHLELSTSAELLPRLRWLAILSGRVKASMAVTGGVHEPIDALKAVMAGAHAVQVVSALLKHGPGKLAEIRDGLAAWLEENEYESLRQAQGSLSLERCPDPNAYERANYVGLLQGWSGPEQA
jgi:dihydroorotate dehydrogenase (fumarate)